MAPLRLDFSELGLIFDVVSGGLDWGSEAYICKETGRIYYYSAVGDNEEDLPDDLGDPERYIEIPTKRDLNMGKRLVMRFTSEYLPDALDDVEQIFRRRGAYGRFKDLLEGRGQLDQWYDYENSACSEALRAWCEQNGIEVAERAG